MHEVVFERVFETGLSGYLKSAAPVEDREIVLFGVGADDSRRALSSSRLTHYRPDLVIGQQVPHPYSGFVLPIPSNQPIWDCHHFLVEIGEEVVCGFERLPPAVNGQGVDAKRVLAMSSRSFYGINGWEISDGILRIEGVLTPENGDYRSIRFHIPDGIAATAHWPIHSEETRDFYWYMPGCPYFNFRIDVDLMNSVFGDSGYCEIIFEIDGDREGRNGLRNVSIPLDFRAYTKYPPSFNVERVQRLSNPVGSVIAGFSDAHRIAKLIGRYRDLDGPLTIADWGVGFGRVLRHMPTFAPQSRLVGIELDDINLDWMRGAFPNIEAVKADLPDRIAAPDACIDIVYGISVMTHIRVPEQVAWLRELVRILKDDGLLILTVAGANALAFTSRWLESGHIDKWDRDGEIVFGNEGGIDSDIGGGGYYIQSKQSPAVIDRVWSELVEVVDFIPAVFGYQDAVVARPRRRG